MGVVNTHEAKTNLSKLIDEGRFGWPPTSTPRCRDLHKDPFDRILLAQAITEPLYFLTADRSLSVYSDLVLTV